MNRDADDNNNNKWCRLVAAMAASVFFSFKANLLVSNEARAEVRLSLILYYY
jgi:hypothetical protein